MHIPVLLQEVTSGLSPKEGQTILDATVGGGGHSEALCKAMKKGTIVCLDEDEDALARSRARLHPMVGGCGCKFLFSRVNFRRLDDALHSLGIGKINHALFDLGMSSFQLEESGRGFSFQKDEPLLMTFGKILPLLGIPFSSRGGSPPDGRAGALDGMKGRIEEMELTAAEIVNTWEEKNIATILFGYGEERQAKLIARAIASERRKKPIATTGELARLIERVVRRRGRIHPATKTFQALRIAVNDEYGALQEAIPKAFAMLRAGGRMAIISFHSLEDRFIKGFFRELKQRGSGAILTKKPIVAGADEKRSNPRARSAKLRIIEKL